MRGIYLTDEQFAEKVTNRQKALNLTKGETVIGCPLCGAQPTKTDTAEGQQ